MFVIYQSTLLTLNLLLISSGLNIHSQGYYLTCLKYL